MGHREQLLRGAIQCLYERGYTRTTARDIVAASGTNLASIGYHYGSKDALLTSAMVQALGDWGDALREATHNVEGDDPLSRMEAIWTGVIDSVRQNPTLWTASSEIYTEAFHQEELRERLQEAYRESRPWFAQMTLGEAPGEKGPSDERVAKAVGSLVLAIVSGLSVQWLLDPDDAPTAAELVAALRTVLAVSS
ncbi:MAG: hypothetical protein QG622_2932 [Actinomycetota bacterium]|nr:hypothetical protein [Actinomycetota bacterium]